MHSFSMLYGTAFGSVLKTPLSLMILDGDKPTYCYRCASRSDSHQGYKIFDFTSQSSLNASSTCSSDHAGRMPGARTQSKLPIEIVAGNRRTSSHVCTQPQTHASRSGFLPGTNVGAACSCHPTGSDHHRSTRVPLHPVWPRAASCTLMRTILACEVPV